MKLNEREASRIAKIFRREIGKIINAGLEPALMGTSDGRYPTMYKVRGTDTPLPCMGVGDYSSANKKIMYGLVEDFLGVPLSTPVAGMEENTTLLNFLQGGSQWGERWQLWREWLILA